MSIEVTVLISVASTIIGIFLGFAGYSRNKKQDDAHTTAQMTTVIVKLENISNGVNKIEAELLNVKQDVRNNHDDIIVIKESSKQAHNRLDGFETRLIALEAKTSSITTS